MNAVRTGAATALIGHTGFVGSNLLRQRSFDATFNSSNIEALTGREFNIVVCCGARAEKWKANADPDGDLANVERLERALAGVSVERLVLISTVDVFGNPVGVDEESPVELAGLHAYGRNRRHLEEFVAGRFPATIIRLPGLYGPGLKKNAIHDLVHDHDVHKIDSRGVFQFYDVLRLWSDIEASLANELPLVHLPTEPVSIAEVARAAFGREFENEIVASPACYDVQTRYASLFGAPASSRYIEDKSEELARIREFVATERASSLRLE